MKRVHQDHQPVAERRSSGIMVPCRIEAHEAIEERPAGYSYLPVLIPDRGDDISDLAALRVARYADLRKAFYGDWHAQLEKQYDGVWKDHVLAVKAEFPKPGQV